MCVVVCVNELGVVVVVVVVVPLAFRMPPLRCMFATADWAQALGLVLSIHIGIYGVMCSAAARMAPQKGLNRSSGKKIVVRSQSSTFAKSFLFWLLQTCPNQKIHCSGAKSLATTEVANARGVDCRVGIPCCEQVTRENRQPVRQWRHER